MKDVSNTSKITSYQEETLIFLLQWKKENLLRMPLMEPRDWTLIMEISKENCGFLN